MTRSNTTVCAYCGANHIPGSDVQQEHERLAQKTTPSASAASAKSASQKLKPSAKRLRDTNIELAERMSESAYRAIVMKTIPRNAFPEEYLTDDTAITGSFRDRSGFTLDVSLDMLDIHKGENGEDYAAIEVIVYTYDDNGDDFEITQSVDVPLKLNRYGVPNVRELDRLREASEARRFTKVQTPEELEKTLRSVLGSQMIPMESSTTKREESPADSWTDDDWDAGYKAANDAMQKSGYTRRSIDVSREGVIRIQLDDSAVTYADDEDRLRKRADAIEKASQLFEKNRGEYKVPDELKVQFTF